MNVTAAFRETKKNELYHVFLVSLFQFVKTKLFLSGELPKASRRCATRARTSYAHVLIAQDADINDQDTLSLNTARIAPYFLPDVFCSDVQV